jgi:hypothetical protein
MRTFALTVALLAVAGLARADDDDPEPPGGSSAALRKLKGTWISVRMIMKGKEGAYTSASYAFEKDKVTYTFGKGVTGRAMTLQADKKRRDVILMTPDKGVTLRFFFKIEKGELYLTPAPADAKAKADFSGKERTAVIILKKEK